MENKLNFEIIPDGCWYNNLRTILSKKAWDVVRKEAYCRADGRCMICGRKVTRLEAHERWSYDEENAICKLEDVVAVCKDCHSVIHIGRTQLMGNIERAENHYMKVNGKTYAEYRHDLGIANQRHQELNKISEWKYDLSYLKKFITEETKNTSK